MLKKILIAGALFLASAVLFPFSASAATRNVTCSGDITSDLNTAIGASATNDIVNISAGSCSMTPVSVSDKNITIQGAGKDVTVITANNGFGEMISNGSGSPLWRMSGFTLTSTVSGIFPLTVWANASASWRGPFRIDHVNFNYPNGGKNISIYGPVYGLIDHNDFNGSYESAILTGLDLNTEGCSFATGGTCDLNNLAGGYAMSLAYQPGGAMNLYIENNTFTGLVNGIAALDTNYSGGRIVFRHNTLTNATLYSHWTFKGQVNTLWWEVYNNKFTWNMGQGMYPMRLQGGGTGLIYNNTFSGFPGNYLVLGEGRVEGQSSSPLLFCDGTHNWDGNGDPSAPGWPCLAQTGRNAGKTLAQIQAGDKPASFPIYLWNNGPQDKCYDTSASGSACDNSLTVTVRDTNYFTSTPHLNGDVDFKISATQPIGAGTHTLNYTPFTYPYPLNTDGTPNPSGGGTSDTIAPSVPTDLTATAISSSQINLSWTASTDNVAVTGYKIFRNGTQVGTSATNSYSDTGLTASTLYSYTVSAYDVAGNTSTSSAGASATTQATQISDTTAPSAPTALSATDISTTQINLAWTASTDNTAVTGYNIFRDGVQVGTSVTNSYSDTNLTPSTLYTYTVSAYDAAGNTSAPSLSASATTQAVTPPAFSIGARVKTTSNLNVRSKPSTNPSSKVRCTQPAGSLGTITAGPNTGSGYTWWNVNYDTGCDGWSIQNYLTTAVTALAPSSASLAVAGGTKLTRQLEVGSTGEDVSLLQTFLASHDHVYPEKIVSGYYGNMTASAVSAFQGAYGLPSVGRVGPMTLQKLNELLETFLH